MTDIKRKRGRPRKESTIQKTQTNTPEQIIYEEEIVVQLPITKADINKLFETENTDLDQNDNDNDIETENLNSNDCKKLNNQVFVLDDMYSSTDTSSIEYSAFELNAQLKSKNKLIDKQQKEIQLLKSKISENIPSKDKQVYETNLKLIDSEGKNIKNNNNISCWYCTYNFDNEAYFLPETIYNDKCHVLGCFCSPNCAASYNIKKLNDYKVSERLSLLKQLYNIDKLYLSPEPEVLEKYGGPLTIEKYRENMITNNHTYNFIIPPLIAINPIVEEFNNNYIPVKNNNKKKLVLKRSKPLPRTKNTLKNTMGLIIN
tara:strand:+ start:428 stop:1375 length:948 start_codon:yes stop_codon:yes gene_type:complete